MVDNDLLFKTLFHLGFRGISNDWLASYLYDRKQYVDVNGTASHILSNEMGVPQGSTLGPILFLLYINDLPNSLINMKSINFADDITHHLNFVRNHYE